MARPLRIEYPGAWYHVMNRGLGRRNIFLSDKDRRGFFDVLSEASEMFKMQIHAYCLMDNHYHLLIHTPEGRLGRGMRHVNGVYTQKFNKKHFTDGPLFRGRYKALLVDSDEYLLELVRYIHLNPVEARICDDPKKHPWTSHFAYLSEKDRPDWLNVAEVLGRFASNEQNARHEMDAFVRAGVPHKFKKDLREMKTMLGAQGFQEWVYRNFCGEEKIGDKKLEKQKLRMKISPKRIMECTAFAYGTGISDLRISQRGLSNEARNTGIYLMRRFTGMRQGDIAKWFNCGNGYTVATVQRRLKAQMAIDRKLKKKVALIERTLES